MSSSQTPDTSSRQAYEFAADALMTALPAMNRDSRSDTSLEELRARFSEGLRQVAIKERELLIKESPEALRARMRSEFSLIQKHDQVVAVELASEPLRLIVHTVELFCEHPKTHLLHAIGEFAINIALKNAPGRNSVLWKNKTRHVDGLDGPMEAPHVVKGGDPCLGNMEGAYEDLISRGEYYAALVMAIAFVESVNITDNWGKYIERWPVVGRRSTPD